VKNKEWKSITDVLPGIANAVFVYSEKTKEVEGPVYLMENKGTEIRELKGWDVELNTGHRTDQFEGIGIFAYAWFKGGIVFTKFMPTHWTECPEPPKGESDKG